MAKPSSDFHIRDCKKKYLRHSKMVPKGGVIITGYGKGGIAEQIRKVLEAQGRKVYPLSAVDMDLRSPGSMFAAMGNISFRHQKISALVNCGGDMDLQWFENYLPSRMEELIRVNLLGPMYLSKKFIQKTIDLPWPKHVVHIGSMAARTPLNGSAPYCIAKAGLEMMCRCMAWELAPKNFNVLCVHPSGIEETPMGQKTISKIQEFRGVSRKEAKDYWRTGMIRDRLLSKMEVARVVELFLSGKCDYLSGSAVCLTGGSR